MRYFRKKRNFLLGFIIISAIFIVLRTKTLNHLLMWDEAWNILSLRAFLNRDASDPFYWNYFSHPPLYMAFAQALYPFGEGFDVRLELLSLVFSYAALAVTYILGARMGGWKYAFLSGLFLSLMPVSIGYDTWIKRDGLALALGYLAFYLLINEKFLWAAVALSFSFLSKESALYFIIAAIIYIFITQKKKPLAKTAFMCVVILALTSWWYIGLSTMTTCALKIFSVEDNISTWYKPPTYYLARLVPDLGIGILVLLIIGVAYFGYLISRRQKRWVIAIIVLLSVYLPASFFIACKAPWLCLAARPAMALTAGLGALCLLKMARRRKFLLAVFVFLISAASFTGLSFSYAAYHRRIMPNDWRGAEVSRDLASYLNKHMKEQDRLMITEFAYWKRQVCPIFVYYWNSHLLKFINGNSKVEDVIREIRQNKISWFVVADSPDPYFNFHRLVNNLKDSTLGEPDKRIEWINIWKTRAFWAQDAN